MAKMARTNHLSKPALDALDQMRRSCPTPHNLEGVLWDLEFADRLTVSQILLRRELRRMTPEDRRSLIREITDFTIECPMIPEPGVRGGLARHKGNR